MTGRRHSSLTHVRNDGTAQMVDVSAKAVTIRAATAVGRVLLSAEAVAALVLIDMVKAVDRHARITDVRVTAKSGGRSGDWAES
jgi:cyclic pyranopterin monophosphate synthase